MRTHEHVQLPPGAAALLGQRVGFGESQPLSGGLFPHGTTPLLSAMMGGLAQHGAAGGAGGAGGAGSVGVAGGAGPLGAAAGLSHASIAALVMAQSQASALGANGMQQQMILAALQAAAAGSASGTSYQNGHHGYDDMEEDSDPDREMRYDDRWSNGGSHGVERGLVAHGGADALGGFSRPRRLDKSEVKKAKRGVYIALREVSLAQQPSLRDPNRLQRRLRIGPPRLWLSLGRSSRVGGAPKCTVWGSLTRSR
jgi:hypothetical protein